MLNDEAYKKALGDSRRIREKLLLSQELAAAKLIGNGHYVRVTPAMRLRARAESTLRRRLAAWFLALARRIDPDIDGGG
jgi:hypothetical protein